ncbi:MAG: DUF4192 domain-containing protein [Candidatus Nanopelagicales bacterium]
MTAEQSLPPITCPTSLIGSCAPLLGFVPDRCVVAFVHGVPGRRAPVIVRMELPTSDPGEQIAAQLAASMAGTAGTSVDLVAWVRDPDDTRLAALTSNAFLISLAAFLEVLHIEQGASLSTNGQVWWSHSCQDESCCSGQSIALDPGVLGVLQAEYVYAGYAPLASRADLAQRIAPDPERAAEVRSALRRTREPARTSRWRDAQISFLTRLLLPAGPCGSPVPTLTPATAARLIRAMEDLRVRDVVLHRLVVGGRDCDPCWTSTVDTLIAAVQSAPAGMGAPVATILGLVTWLRGEGALATLCVERALDEDPDYRLADLAVALMTRGTDPRVWRASLVGLPESECRSPRGR